MDGEVGFRNSSRTITEDSIVGNIKDTEKSSQCIKQCYHSPLVGDR